MSFDINFLASGRPFAETIAERELAAQSDPQDFPSEADDARWQATTAALASLWSNVEHFEGPTHREMTDMARGAQLTLGANELSLSVPYWHAGADAASIEAWLREVVSVIEQTTGLVGYNPQSDSRFLDTPPGQTAETMTTHLGNLAAPKKPGMFGRFFRSR